jgi:hypothetical protein
MDSNEDEEEASRLEKGFRKALDNHDGQRPLWDRQD